MKKTVFLLILIVLALTLCACNAKTGEITDTSASDSGSPPPLEDGLCVDGSHVLIYPRNNVDIDAAYRFAFLFEGATGIKLKSARDVQTPIEDGAREIVFGMTDREDLCPTDRSDFIADAFSVKVSGNRIFVSAVSADGYEAAFCYLLYEMLGIEDINNMTKTDSEAILARDLDYFGAPRGTLAENTTESGVKYSVSGEARKAYNYCEFSEKLTYTFSPFGKDFNYFTVKYSSETALRGVITYVSGGKETHEEFFLEGGKNQIFSSLTDGFLSASLVSDVTKIEFTVLGANTSVFRLEDVTTDKRELPDADTVYISNSEYKLGVRLTWGGGISYLEDLLDGDESLKNLLNDHDTGRLVQQSYYGTNKAPYECGSYNGQTWGYNPVQGGDQYNNRSKLVDFKVEENAIYVKCRPLDWAKKNVQTPSYMENTYTLRDGHIEVNNRFTDFSGYTHRKSHQELPAFYTVSYLSEFVCYLGSDAWKGGELTVKSSLPFWAGNDSAYHTLKSGESWCAWRAPGGYGVGVYTPIAEILLAGRYEYNGSKDSGNNATNYVAPLITATLKSYEPFEYSYYITTGSTDEIRSEFSQIAGKGANQ